MNSMYAVIKMKFMGKAEILHMSPSLDSVEYYISVVKPEGDIRIFKQFQ